MVIGDTWVGIIEGVMKKFMKSLELTMGHIFRSVLLVRGIEVWIVVVIRVVVRFDWMSSILVAISEVSEATSRTKTSSGWAIVESLAVELGMFIWLVKVSLEWSVSILFEIFWKLATVEIASADLSLMLLIWSQLSSWSSKIIVISEKFSGSLFIRNQSLIRSSLIRRIASFPHLEPLSLSRQRFSKICLVGGSSWEISNS